jgi:arylsulfatase A-like enzyme
MRSGFRAVWGSALVCVWIGLLIGVADVLTLVSTSTLIHVFEGAPFGVQFSVFGWFHTQTRTIALDLLAFIGLGAVLGLLLALLSSAYILIRRGDGPGREALERLFYSGFALAAMVIPGLLTTIMAMFVAIYDPGRTPLFVIFVAVLTLALMAALVIMMYRWLAGTARPGTLWLSAGAIIGVGAFFILGLRGAMAFPDAHKYWLGALFIAVWTLLSYGLFRLAGLMIARVKRVFFYKVSAVIGTAAATGLLLLVVAGIYRPPPAAEAGPGPNIVLIVLDTVRADRMSVYGHERPTTPALERMAEEGVLFTRAFAPAPWTLPSHGSFFTGLYPGRHHCTHEHLWLDEEFVTIAEIFRARDYVTLGYSNNPIVGRMSKLDQGFDLFVEGWKPELSVFIGAGIIQTLSWVIYPDLFPADAGAAETYRVVGRWLADLKDSRSPFFLFINYMEAHPPMPRHAGAFVYFNSHSEARERLSGIKEDHVTRNAGLSNLSDDQKDALLTLYDGEIKYLDTEVGKILDSLKERDLYRNTVVIVISDHGEMFDEHGGLWGHERALYHSLLHVPFIITGPGIPAGEKVDMPISLRDLPAMLMALQQGGGLDGMLAAAVPQDRPELDGILAEIARPVAFINVIKKRFPGHDTEPLDRRQKALIRYPWKLIWDSKGADVLYNIEDDPGELENRSKENFSVYHELSQRITRYRARYPEDEKVYPVPPLDHATRERLRALGYLP